MASTPTLPVCVFSAAGLTAGSIPTNCTFGKVWRKYVNAAAYLKRLHELRDQFAKK